MKAIMFKGMAAMLVASFITSTSNGQIQWTADQKAVWKTETAITDAWMKGDNATADTYYDESYQGWPEDVPIPVPKANMTAGANYQATLGGKLVFWNAVPVVIWVKGDFAYTDYYYRAVYQDKDGKKTNEHGRWLDVLMKKDGKWLLVGDRGGQDREPAAK
ncbi:MAG: DUF4440 domain-containing protein [Bacteroidota bacterium]|nr:DUF4440 domain-containing protein [Bacteroidota bacterium]MDP4249218.1 DUF4440 domain-containing protein [Bacteroidota bacterium]